MGIGICFYPCSNHQNHLWPAVGSILRDIPRPGENPRGLDAQGQISGAGGVGGSGGSGPQGSCWED